MDKLTAILVIIFVWQWHCGWRVVFGKQSWIGFLYMQSICG